MKNGTTFSNAFLWPMLVFAVLLIVTAVVPESLDAQQFDQESFKAMKWRLVGPFRGGRAVAAVGVASQPSTFYMGATGGGVWKTVDGGLIWKNVSDGFMKTGSVGSIAVSLSDPNVVYVGMGEAGVRDITTTHGDGVYRSNDAGKTWTHLGLEKTRHIAQVRIHSTNPDIVYVAAQGSPWADNPERGIYRSKDGGKTWDLVLHVDSATGASDLSMDMTNPRILYAFMWQHRRKPWHGYQLNSGGPGSGLYKSTDGGDTWEELTGKGGLPSEVGKIGVSVSPVNSDRVFALVEAEKDGVYRSDDGGETWKRVNSDHVVTERTAYYCHIFADSQDENTVYVLNAPFLKSIDGGVTFARVQVRHGDNHDLWIHPDNNKWMVSVNDGGASVSYDGGKTWSAQDNQPTAQFYRVITDNIFPYNLYAGQQDNSTVKISSQSMRSSIGTKDWHAIGGGESAHVAFDPDNPKLVYAGNYQCQITEYNLETGLARNIQYYPLRTAFRDGKDYPLRCNWNAPIVASSHDPKVIYHAGNVLLKSTNGGESWEEVSPDLTRNEQELQEKVEGPFTTDGIAGAIYNTIFYVAESPHEAGTIYAGTDDGFVHITKDGGKTWSNVTPEGIDRAQINAIEVSTHDPATAYFTATNHKYGDFTPHVFKTENYGESWKRIVKGIGEEAWARVVREDPKRKDLLYLGTEAGMYLSFNGGDEWQAFQLNLPIVPITDLRVHADDLVAATQGRAFWILDDLTPLHQVNPAIMEADQHLFEPRSAYRIDGRGGRGVRSAYGAGENPPNGAIIYYSLAKAPDVPVELEFLDANDEPIRTFSSEKKEDKLPLKAGMNRFVWNLLGDDIAVPFKDIDNYRGPRAYRVKPGSYKVRLKVGEETQTQTFEVLGDPRLDLSAESFQRQERFMSEVYQTVEALYDSIGRMRNVTGQLEALVSLVAEGDMADGGKALLERIGAWEDKIVQTQHIFYQKQPDPLHSPDRLDFNMIWIMTTADRAGPPLNAGPQRRFNDLKVEWGERQAEMEQILEDLRGFNAVIQKQSLPPVVVPAKGGAPTTDAEEQ